MSKSHFQLFHIVYADVFTPVQVLDGFFRFNAITVYKDEIDINMDSTLQIYTLQLLIILNEDKLRKFQNKYKKC